MITPEHWQEWVDSAVDPHIIRLNVRSLEWLAAYEYLFYSDRLPRTNPGVLARGILNTYSILDSGGWWCSGVDPLNDWQPMLWGCFKPNRPRFDFEKRKHIKYEHPPKTETRVFLLQVPDAHWEKVSARYGIPIDDEDRQRGFWYWVWRCNVPVIITEGAKKAGALLSAGFAALALPGITGGVRTRDEQGNKIEPYLIPDLKKFATLGRFIYVCFDSDAKHKTILSVNRETGKLASLFSASGCKVSIICLPGPEKGVDDFVIARGVEAFDALYQNAQPFRYWQARQHYSLTLIPSLRLNQRYLGDIPFPSSGLAAVKSAKGTGKTYALRKLIARASYSGRRTLVITHRIQLGRAICDALGIDWIEDMRDSETKGLLGYGLCIDSLHPESQAQFNPLDWAGTIVVLDEVEQVLWHALNSSTCYSNRIAILQTLAELIHTVLSTGGLVIAQDADLSDISIDYLKAISNIPVEPWVVINEWKPESGWDVTFYDALDPSPLFAELERILPTGPVFIVEDCQKIKGKWSSRNLETQFQGRFPDKRILRIDSESVSDPTHPAYGCVEKINSVVQRYDIIIASPTIGTGVSIDIRGYFKGVFGVFKGALAPTDALQMLARVRDSDVPRFVWAALFGGKVGNGSSNYRSIIKSQAKVIKTNIRLLQDIDFDIDSATDPIHVRTWAMMAARINGGMWDYRLAIQLGLSGEGHQVQPCRELQLQQQISELRMQENAAINAQDWDRAEQLEERIAPLKEELDRRFGEAGQLSNEASVVRIENKQAEAIAVSSSELPTEAQYKELKKKRSKTASERHTERKYELHQRYGVEVTPELKLQDDDGWYPKFRIHYHLTHEPEFARQRDLRHLAEHLERGGGKAYSPDLKFITATVEALNKLGITQFLNPDKEFRATDLEVSEFVTRCLQCSRDIKEYLGITIHPLAKPMEVVQIILRQKLGITLKCIRQEYTLERDSRGRRKRIRVYKFVPPLDGRQEIFEVWQQRDLEAMERNAALVTPSTADTGADKYIDISDPVTQGGVSGVAQTVLSQDMPVSPSVVESPSSTPKPTVLGRAVEILTRCGQWLSGYFYVGRIGDCHQLRDRSGYRGIKVTDNEFRFVPG